MDSRAEFALRSRESPAAENLGLLEFDRHRTTAEEQTMTETRTPVEAPSTRRIQQHRRVKRGVVASYIHQISERHNDDAADERLATEAAAEAAEEQVA
jgi:hypothetical protein